MGLFGKKDPCAICGSKVTGLFPGKVAGRLVCKECYGNVHLPEDAANNMTIEEFQAYRAFRDENAQLKANFQTTRQVPLGLFKNDIVLDSVNGLFCMTPLLDETIFEGKHVRSFTIREDGDPLFEGSAAGLVRYTSSVPDRLAAMSSSIQRTATLKWIQREAERWTQQEDGQDGSVHTHYYRDVPEPFRKFVVEINCEHPYWKQIKVERGGPTFSDEYPNIQEYLREYQEGAEIMEQLARGLMEVAFPGAPELRAGSPVMPGQSAAAPAPSGDVAAEIRKFKELMDQGLLTEEEFAAKKRQLLGI